MKQNLLDICLSIAISAAILTMAIVLAELLIK